MFKKLLCGVVAAALVMTAAPVLPVNSTVSSAEAVKVTNGSLKKAGWWTEFSDSWKLEKGKQLTLKFTHESDFAQPYHIFVGVLSSTADGLKTPASRPANYFEYAVVRGDLYGWSTSTKVCAADQNTGSGDATTFKAGTQMSYDGKVIAYTTDFDRNWDTLKEVLKNADVTLTLQRGDTAAKMIVDAVSRTDATKKINYTATISLGKTQDTDSAADADLYFTLTAEQAAVNISSADISDITGDTQITAPPTGTGTPNTNNNNGQPSVNQSATLKAKITAKKGKKSVSKVTVKKGKKVTLKVSVVPKKAKLSLGKLSKKQKKIATVTFKNKKLTIKGKKKGKVTVKITSARLGVYKKTTKSIKVTVK